MEEEFKFRRVHEIAGTFVLVIVALLIAGIIWTGHSQRWFKSRVPLRIVLPETGAAGIRQGSEVYFLGTLVGSVYDVVVEPTGRMEAEANIRRDFFRFVRVDSSAVEKSNLEWREILSLRSREAADGLCLRKAPRLFARINFRARWNPRLMRFTGKP